MDALRALGTVVWLRGELDLVLERARRSGTRPMLDSRSPEEIVELYRQREPYYKRAHEIIDTTGLGVDQVVHRVITRLSSAHAGR